MGEEINQSRFNFVNIMGDNFKDDSETKVCTKCEENRPLSFYSSEGGYLKSVCKVCISYNNKVVRELKKTTERPPKDYLCPICKRNEEDVSEGKSNGNSWVLDHCHDKEIFRGWLCHKCNRAIGCFNDDIERIQRTLNYLKKHTE
tara:strand:- start:3120 stop:3554 length:435 start_codon:yes stop_codon:yes gene_type:complete